MNAISFPRHFAVRHAVIVHDVGDSIKSWGRRGIVSGGLFGFALAAILVAIPLTTDVLTFGTIGTLIVGAVECAVIAGGFAALAAALYGHGVARSTTAGFEWAAFADRKSADANWPEGAIPQSDWPERWAFPGSPARQPVQFATGDYSVAMDAPPQEIQTPLSAISS